jgi:hypothetical protein
MLRRVADNPLGINTATFAGSGHASTPHNRDTSKPLEVKMTLREDDLAQWAGLDKVA